MVPTQWKPGESGNPRGLPGRPKGLPGLIRDHVGENGEELVAFLLKIFRGEGMEQKETKEDGTVVTKVVYPGQSLRLEAWDRLTDRGFGKAVQQSVQRILRPTIMIDASGTIIEPERRGLPAAPPKTDAGGGTP